MEEQVAARLKQKSNSDIENQNESEYSWGRSSAGRAPALQAGGQEFDPLRLHLNRKDSRACRKTYKMGKHFNRSWIQQP